MPVPHLDDDLLDQYALGSLPAESLAAVEEHLLGCRFCQARVTEADDFLQLFRAAATQPDVRRVPMLRRLFSARLIRWTAVVVATAACLVLFSNIRKAPPSPTTVMLQALRGPENSVVISAGKPVRLVFDITPHASEAYVAHIVDPIGKAVLKAPLGLKEGHLVLLIEKLGPGYYWVRVYRGTEPVAEYALRAE